MKIEDYAKGQYFKHVRGDVLCGSVDKASVCVEERLFRTREINAILGSCEVPVVLVLLRSSSGGLEFSCSVLTVWAFGRSAGCTVLRRCVLQWPQKRQSLLSIQRDVP